MSFVTDIVTGQFAQAQSYANSAQTQVATFLSALNGAAAYAVPTINLTWSSVEGPATVASPANVTLTAVDFTAPTEPTAPTLEMPEVTVPTFTGVAPTLSFGTKPTIANTDAPVLEFGTMPALSAGAAPTLDFGTAPVIDTGTAPTPSYGAAPSISLPAAPTLDFGAAPTLTVADAPDMTIGPAPTLDFGVRPTVGAVADVAFPDEITFAMPSAPTLLSLSTPSFGGVDMHDAWLAKLEDTPTLTLLAPTPYSYAPGPEYASELLDALKATLNNRLAGGTGLSPAVEQAIWDRGRSRETQTALGNEADILRTSESLGFQLPPGVIAAQIRAAQQDYYDKLSTLSRDVAIKQAELEQENLKQAIDEGIRLEGQLTDYSYKLEALTFESAKEQASNAIAAYNSQVEKFKALISVYAVYESAYKTIIEAEMAKVEVYKAELQAEQTKAQVNMTLVGQYKAEIDARMAFVEIYKAQIGAANARIGLEQAKLSMTGEEIRAYIAGINGETAKLEAYKAEVQVKAVVAEVYKTGVQAELAKVELYKAGIDAQAATIAAYRAGIEARMAGIEVYKTALQTDQIKAELYKIGVEAQMTTIQAYKAGVEAQTAVVEAYRAAIQADAAKVDLYKAGVSAEATKIEAFKAGVQADATAAEVYKIGVDSEVSKVTAFKAKVDAFAAQSNVAVEVARTNISKLDATVRAKALEWDAYKARLQAGEVKMRGQMQGNELLIAKYRTEGDLGVAQYGSAVKRWEVQLKDYEAGKQAMLQAAKINGDNAMHAASARADAAKVGAQVYAQLVGSALSIARVDANVQASGSTSVQYQYKNSTSSVPPGLATA